MVVHCAFASEVENLKGESALVVVAMVYVPPPSGTVSGKVGYVAEIYDGMLIVG